MPSESIKGRDIGFSGIFDVQRIRKRIVGRGRLRRGPATHNSAGGDGWGLSRTHWFRLEVGLWLVVSLAFALDGVTTTVGLQHGFVESNPLLRAAFAVFGSSVIWPLKAGALALALACWATLPRDERVLVPVVFGLPWAFAVGANLGLLLTL
ncbi:DUF5658 family protein [Salinigranum halophilum]|uniref:DUF5658 family protein n=1 Tax=Salinigranum halophilum TaxID=2565931 RepID=UPI00115ED49B|nr:DUF5658 family protein [Salinigranum halophilum]